MGCLKLTYEAEVLEEDFFLSSEKTIGKKSDSDFFGVKSDHLGNVRVVLSDAKNSVGLTSVTAAYDYYPFGQIARSYNPTAYKYGFNGMEKDNEIEGEGNSYDFGARMYDPRLGRWWSLDALSSKYPNLSPYVFAGNNPILFVDYDGKDYGVYVNHETKTIVIKATIYTTRSMTADRKASSEGYNRAVLAAKYYENVKAQYIVKNDQGEDVIYNVSFEFDVKKQDPIRNDTYEKAKADPEGNMFMSGIPGQHVTTEAGNRTGPNTKIRDGEKVEGYTEGLTNDKQYIYVEGAAALENPKSFYILDVHEMGHTMVSLTEEFHNQSGTVMQSDEHQGGGSPGPNLPAGFIENILSNIGLGNAPVGENKPNAELHQGGGPAPANFKSGTVQNIQNDNIK